MNSIELSIKLRIRSVIAPLIVTLIVICAGSALAQVPGGQFGTEPDAPNTDGQAEILPKDSLPPKTKYSFKKSFNEYYPHPRTAVYLGLGFPAGGQIYIKDYWKVPLAWAGSGFVGYLAIDNTGFYRRLRDAVLQRLRGEEDEFITIIPQVNQLRARRDQARKQMEQTWIALIFTHVLITAESFVSAHLKSFDVTDDLGIEYKLRPKVYHDMALGNLSPPPVGVQLNITF